MTASGTASPLSGQAPQEPISADLVQVELVWIEKQIEQWIRFGREQRDQIIDRRRRILFFPAGATFGLVRWAANEHGTVLSRIDIVRTVASGEALQTLPNVTPGGEILLRADGWPAVERVLQLIDAIEDRGIDPVFVSTEHWRHVHNRIAAGQTPRAYTEQHHRAALQRRRVLP